jgi:hypothetical protein
MNFILFIPCIIDNQFTTVNQQNAQQHALDVYNNITPNIATCSSPQRIIVRGSHHSNNTKPK